MRIQRGTHLWQMLDRLSWSDKDPRSLDASYRLCEDGKHIQIAVRRTYKEDVLAKIGNPDAQIEEHGRHLVITVELTPEKADEYLGDYEYQNMVFD